MPRDGAVTLSDVPSPTLGHRLRAGRAARALPPGPADGRARRRDAPEGVVMSGWRPLIKGYFGVALVVGAVMSSAFGAEN
jgi:hypothetical protein